MMQGWSQEDYDERKQRQNDGQASDEDRRLIKQYEQAGFEQTRLKEERETLKRVERAGMNPDAGAKITSDGGMTVLQRPAVNADKATWIEFAEQVNATLDESVRPISVPADAKKDELVGFYKTFGEPAA